MKNRNYDEESKDIDERKYAYNFDFLMHYYMLESFKPFFNGDNVLELGSYEGDFTNKLLLYFNNITCIEASKEAVIKARERFKFLKEKVLIINKLFDDVLVGLSEKYDNIVLTHVLEHVDDPIRLLKKINDEWLSSNGRLFLVCPNANAISRQIAVKMGLISHNQAVTPAEEKHGHRCTYTLDTLERDVVESGLKVIYRSGIFLKALANFQWDKLLQTDIISDEYLDGCFELGQKYPDLCSSIFLVCQKGCVTKRIKPLPSFAWEG